MTELKKVTEVDNTAPVLTVQEQLQAAIAAGNYTEVARLAKVAANKVKLDAIADAAAKVEADKIKEVAEVAKIRTELIDQLTAGTFQTFAGLWMIINTTVPAPVKAAKAAKVSVSTGTHTNSNGRETKNAILARCLVAGDCTLAILTDAFTAVYPEDTDAANHAKQYISKYAKKVGDFYVAK
jgi:hypothetical protein